VSSPSKVFSEIRGINTLQFEHVTWPMGFGGSLAGRDFSAKSIAGLPFAAAITVPTPIQTDRFPQGRRPATLMGTRFTPI
jgi:hypothetical protein